MLQIIDNSLMAPLAAFHDRNILYRFCELLFVIGVDTIELPVGVVEFMGKLPEGKYVLHVTGAEEVRHYPGFYRYVSHQPLNIENGILEIQLNDVREMPRLKNYRDQKEIRIHGLDDLLCHTYEKMIPEMLHSLPRTKIIFCPENTYGCACALAYQWLTEYGKDATTSFAGIMNNAATEELLMILRLNIRHKPNRDLSVLPEMAEIYEKITGKKIGNRKPIMGSNIFKVEAGIHADGIHKNPVTYEAYGPASVGGRFELVIGKHSGTRAVRMKLEQLDIPVPGEEVIEELLNQVKSICTQNRKSLNDEEFLSLLAEVMADERKKAYR
jgi:homocitrate synthase NifV